MGFMDKAKKMAEQAQQKLDEVQKGFNEGQGSSSPGQQGPVTQYDAHGRPVPPADAAPPAPSAPAAPPTQPHGDPLGGATPPPPPPPPAPEAATAPPPPAPPAPEGAAPPAPPAPAPEGERSDEYAPPKLSSGDPLAG
jgi:hypothetical protein